jgi:hypothetical protein
MCALHTNGQEEGCRLVFILGGLYFGCSDFFLSCPLFFLGVMMQDRANIDKLVPGLFQLSDLLISSFKRKWVKEKGCDRTEEG